MGIFLLTWNPSKWIISDEDWLEGVRITEEGDSYDEPWSIGSRRGGIAIGDRVFLVRVHRDRGIVASGVAASLAFRDLHWDPARARKRDLANYVHVTWEWQVRVPDRIPIERLHEKVPGAPWNNLMGSGVKLDESSALALLDLWGREGNKPSATVFPDEVDELYEGPAVSVRVNRYERNPRARALCLEHFGPTCVVCGFTGLDKYGPKGDGLIHVHHLTEVSQRGGEYVVNPLTDLVPVCPTCHAMIHARRPPYTPAEVKRMLRH